ncbi:MAG: hypothetical protein WEA58_04110 [Balneolaceae bacterium]
MPERKQLSLFDQGKDPELSVPESAKGDSFYYSRFLAAQYRTASKTDPKRCEHCKHLRKMQLGHRNFYKCALIGVTHSRATDVRLKGVCNRFDMDLRKLKSLKVNLV